jgi:hypothetical protein
MQQFKATVQQYLHMGRQAQVKHIQWLVNNNYLQNKYIKVIKDKV